MFKLSGEKSNLSAGMASAASTTSFSMMPTSRSIAVAIVAACPCVPLAAEFCPSAPMAAAVNANTTMYFAVLMHHPPSHVEIMSQHDRRGHHHRSYTFPDVSLTSSLMANG